MDDRIEKYLKNEMSVDARTSFEQELTTQPELLEETRAMASIMASLDAIKANELITKFSKPKSKVISMPMWRYAAAIAGIILVGSMYFLNSRQSSQELYEEYHKVYPNVVSPSERSASSNEQMWQLYETGQYEEALSLFQQALDESPSEEIRLYTALSALESDDTDLAVKLLEADYTKFSSQADWYLALAYLKSDETDKMKDILTLIVKKDNAYSERASEMLDLL